MKEQVLNKLDQIAVSIAGYVKKEENHFTPKGLYNGDFGILLFLYYYARYTHAPEDALLADVYTEKLLAGFEESITTHTFCSGLAGILFLFADLRENEFVDIEMEETEALFEDYLISGMRNDMAAQQYDFMHGALGVGLYFLKRKTRTDLLKELIQYLYGTAEKDEVNKVYKWKSLLIKEELKYGYNIALSHGISSIVLFLVKAIQQGIESEYLDPLLEGAVNYLLSQEIDYTTYGSFYPSQSTEQPGKSRLAWCYGDLGIAFAIYRAGEVVRNDEWKAKGLEVLLATTRRTGIEENGIKDGGICHGSAGIAMFFNRMYIETREPAFQQAAEYWIACTLQQASHPEGPAGYKTFEKEGYQDTDYTLLTGIAGIGMTFLSFLTQDTQKWDTIFLLS
ncbi:MAG: lanthionine synthetase C family protein [Tannerellaceae bacterium]|nr:lanthionine synthetase C family protein [Tannerellaceae bacterium]